MVTAAEPSAADAGERDAPGGAVTRAALIRRGRSALPAIGLVVAGVVLFAAYYVQARSEPALSSSAGQALQAWQMWHGNPLLRGWTLSDVSFWTTELPQYALVEMVRGLGPDTVHVAAALSYTLIVVLAMALARGRASGREALTRMLLAAGILLAPSLLFGTKVLLAGPDHTGTQAPVLLIWLVLDRGRTRRWVPAVVAALTAWVLIADPLVLYEVVLPLVVICAVRMYRRRGPLAGHWYELLLAAAMIIAVAVANEVLKAVFAAGGFLVKTPIARFASLHVMTGEFWNKIYLILRLFGADFLNLPVGMKAFIATVHLIGLILAVIALAQVLRHWYREEDLVEQGLAAAIVLLVIAYVLSTKADSNEIIGLLPLGAVLAGRRLACPMLAARLAPVLAVLGVCVLLIFASNVSQAGQPRRMSANLAVAHWLQRHHLHYGVAGYWNANSITADTGGEVKIRPVRQYQHRLVTTPSESDVRWYDPARHDARFLLLAPGPSCWNVCLKSRYLRAEFGRAKHIYRVGHWQVLVYHRNLLAGLPILNWCRHSWSWTSDGTPSARACPGGSVF